MPEKYKLQLLTNNNEVRNTMFTNKSEITIGSSLHTDIRLQQPSVEDNHVQIYFDHMRIRVLGNNVFLNENGLEKNSIYSFQFGDVLRINKHKFVFSLTEPGDFIEDNKIIRQPTMELNGLNLDGNKEKKGALEDLRPQKHEELEADSSKRVKLSTADGEEKNDVISEDSHAQTPELVEEAIVSVALSKTRNVQSPNGLPDDRAALDSSVIKHAIEEQKEVLEKEIKESINHPVRDTPVLPSIGKRNLRDLGEAVIEKEILKTAERVVEDKIKHEHEAIENCLDDLKQNVKDNIKEELREDLKQGFMEDVKEDIRDGVKDVLAEETFRDAIVANVISHIGMKKENIVGTSEEPGDVPAEEKKEAHNEVEEEEAEEEDEKVEESEKKESPAKAKGGKKTKTAKEKAEGAVAQKRKASSKNAVASPEDTKKKEEVVPEKRKTSRVSGKKEESKKEDISPTPAKPTKTKKQASSEDDKDKTKKRKTAVGEKPGEKGTGKVIRSASVATPQPPTPKKKPATKKK